MKIAIQAADLDHDRIDGTRVYILNVLKYLGKISDKDIFFIYHRRKFNPELTPPIFKNYKERKIDFPFFWTQTRFTLEILKSKPDVLWMPMHNIPLLRSGQTKIVVTIHDLAFKYFPKSFTKKDLWKLNLLAKWAIKKSDKIIAVSKSTKKDILKFYPIITADKIKVIHHGFDAELFQKEFDKKEIGDVLRKYKLKFKEYLLYVGAIQPRKNLQILVKAFEKIKLQKKENKKIENLKLVLAGGEAWKADEVLAEIKKSPVKDDIILTGKVNFEDLSILYRSASVFIFPSLYEGFGIPILEAFASEVPVITANNSSLPEVGGKAVEYFNAFDCEELVRKIEKVLNDKKLQRRMIIAGNEQLQKFSWQKCAQETLKFLKE